MRIFFYLLLIAIVLLGSTFAALNMQVVSVNYYIAQRTLPLALLLAFTFSGGCILGLIVGFWFLMKSKIKQLRIRKQLSVVEKELENLRGSASSRNNAVHGAS